MPEPDRNQFMSDCIAIAGCRQFERFCRPDAELQDIYNEVVAKLKYAFDKEYNRFFTNVTRRVNSRRNTNSADDGMYKTNSFQAVCFLSMSREIFKLLCSEAVSNKKKDDDKEAPDSSQEHKNQASDDNDDSMNESIQDPSDRASRTFTSEQSHDVATTSSLTFNPQTKRRKIEQNEKYTNNLLRGGQTDGLGIGSKQYQIINDHGFMNYSIQDPSEAPKLRQLAHGQSIDVAITSGISSGTRKELRKVADIEANDVVPTANVLSLDTRNEENIDDFLKEKSAEFTSNDNKEDQIFDGPDSLDELIQDLSDSTPLKHANKQLVEPTSVDVAKINDLIRKKETIKADSIGQYESQIKNYDSRNKSAQDIFFSSFWKPAVDATAVGTLSSTQKEFKKIAGDVTTNRISSNAREGKEIDQNERYTNDLLKQKWTDEVESVVGNEYQIINDRDFIDQSMTDISQTPPPDLKFKLATTKENSSGIKMKLKKIASKSVDVTTANKISFNVQNRNKINQREENNDALLGYRMAKFDSNEDQIIKDRSIQTLSGADTCDKSGTQKKRRNAAGEQSINGTTENSMSETQKKHKKTHCAYDPLTDRQTNESYSPSSNEDQITRLSFDIQEKQRQVDEYRKSLNGLFKKRDAHKCTSVANNEKQVNVSIQDFPETTSLRLASKQAVPITITSGITSITQKKRKEIESDQSANVATGNRISSDTQKRKKIDQNEGNIRDLLRDKEKDEFNSIGKPRNQIDDQNSRNELTRDQHLKSKYNSLRKALDVTTASRISSNTQKHKEITQCIENKCEVRNPIDVTTITQNQKIIDQYVRNDTDLLKKLVDVTMARSSSCRSVDVKTADGMSPSSQKHQGITRYMKNKSDPLRNSVDVSTPNIANHQSQSVTAANSFDTRKYKNIASCIKLMTDALKKPVNVTTANKIIHTLKRLQIVCKKLNSDVYRKLSDDIYAGIATYVSDDVTTVNSISSNTQDCKVVDVTVSRIAGYLFDDIPANRISSDIQKHGEIDKHIDKSDMLKTSVNGETAGMNSCRSDNATAANSTSSNTRKYKEIDQYGGNKSDLLRKSTAGIAGNYSANRISFDIEKHGEIEQNTDDDEPDLFMESVVPTATSFQPDDVAINNSLSDTQKCKEVDQHLKSDLLKKSVDVTNSRIASYRTGDITAAHRISSDIRKHEETDQRIENKSDLLRKSVDVPPARIASYQSDDVTAAKRISPDIKKRKEIKQNTKGKSELFMESVVPTATIANFQPDDSTIINNSISSDTQKCKEVDQHLKSDLLKKSVDVTNSRIAGYLTGDITAGSRISYDIRKHEEIDQRIENKSDLLRKSVDVPPARIASYQSDDVTAAKRISPDIKKRKEIKQNTKGKSELFMELVVPTVTIANFQPDDSTIINNSISSDTQKCKEVDQHLKSDLLKKSVDVTNSRIAGYLTGDITAGSRISYDIRKHEEIDQHIENKSDTLRNAVSGATGGIISCFLDNVTTANSIPCNSQKCKEIDRCIENKSDLLRKSVNVTTARIASHQSDDVTAAKRISPDIQTCEEIDQNIENKPDFSRKRQINHLDSNGGNKANTPKDRIFRNAAIQDLLYVATTSGTTSGAQKKFRKTASEQSVDVASTSSGMLSRTQNRTGQDKDQTNYLLGIACNKLKQEKDEFDSVGHNVAAKLRIVTAPQRIIAEKLISDILYFAQINNLDSRAVIYDMP